MMDPATHSYLQTLIRQEGRSMMQYLGESYPWTTPENEGLLTNLRRMIDEENQMTEEIAKFLLRHRGRPPFLGAYPMSFTNINFISLDHLLPRLVSFQKGRLAELDVQVNKLLHEESREQVRKLVEMKKRHLSQLEELTASRAQPNPSDRR